MLPEIGNITRHSRCLSSFGGLNLTDACLETEFADMANMSADNRPLLSTRAPRAIWHGRQTINGRPVITAGIKETDAAGITDAASICGKIALCTSTRFYIDGTPLPDLTLEATLPHKIVPFGRGCFIIPDNVLVSVTSPGITANSVNAPVMDFAVTHNNRIFGCRFGENSTGDFVNEIYVSKQGDASAWFSFEGISTDSYAAALGEPGEFTGIAVCADYVLFFKESSVTVMAGSGPADFIIETRPLEGVEAGAFRSVVNIGDSVYYKSRAGITVFDGARVQIVSQRLGIQPFTDVAAGAINNKYYIAMTLGTSRELYVFDISSGLWHKEAIPDIRHFVRIGNALLAVSRTAHLNSLGVNRCYYSFFVTDGRFADNGVNIFGAEEEGSDYLFGDEAPFDWFALTGRIQASPTKRGCLREVIFMLTAENAQSFSVSAIPEGGTARLLKTVTSPQNGLLRVKCRIPACDRLRLRLSGRGACAIHSMTLIYEERDKNG